MAINNIVLSAALRSTVSSIVSTQRTIDVVTERLASGLEVNSAIDQPDNFFTSKSLRNVADDHSRLLDGIRQNIRAVQEALHGTEAVNRLIDQGEAIVLESQAALEAGIVDPAIFEKVVDVSPQPLSTQILAQAPDVYYRLNETAGPIIDSGSGAAGPVNANRQGGAAAGAAALYSNGAAPSVNFDGVNDRIAVSDSIMINTATTPARTVELVFNADTTAGRQVLYEEGAGVNGLTIYIDNGSIYFTAEDDQGANRYADININAPIVAGQTYHAAFVFNGAGGPANGGGGANTFAGYLDGAQVGSVGLAGDALFPSHSGNIGIGAAVDGVQFHDGEAGAGFRFDGRISDVAIHNQALSTTILASHANALNSTTSTLFLNRDYENVIIELDQIVVDANYRGTNLLLNEDLTTVFNPNQTSVLVTEGEDFSARGLGLIKHNNFNDANDLEDILETLREARGTVRSFGTTLVTDLSILQTRDDFTREHINTLESGADDLTLADLNKEGANLLALNTRLSLGVTALGLAGQSQQSTIRLF